MNSAPTPDHDLTAVSHITVGNVIRWYTTRFERELAWGRSKSDHLRLLERHKIANVSVSTTSSDTLIEHVQRRMLDGVSGNTACSDLLLMGVVLRAAERKLALSINTNAVKIALALCRDLNLVDNTDRRRRRLASTEITLLDQYFSTRRGSIPMHDIFWFAIHSARTEGEICQLYWADIHPGTLSGLVRNPTVASGPRFMFTPRAWEIAQSQPRTADRIFPFHSQCIGKAFRVACHELKNLRFQDLHHEAMHRLFEGGYSTEDISQISLIYSQTTFRHYAHLTEQSPRQIP